MRKGIQALDDAIESANQGGGGYSGRLGYFNLKADDSLIVRFLTDLPEVLTVDFYEFIKDNKDKPQNFIVRPDLLEDPEAEDYVLNYGGQQQDYATKELGEPTPKRRTVGIAVVRKEIVREGNNGRPQMDYTDEWTEVELKSGKFEARKFIIIKQAYKNFWSPLRVLYDEYGTICDRDYKITRVGKKTDTNYSIIPKREDPDWDMATSYPELLARYGYGTGTNVEGKEITPESEDRFAYCPMTLDEWADDHCSEKRVKFFLGSLAEREKIEKGDGDETDAKATPAATSTAADDGDEAQASPPAASAGNGKSLQERLAAHK